MLYWSNADGQIVANDLTRENQKVLKVIAKDLRGGVDVKVIHPSIQQGCEALITSLIFVICICKLISVSWESFDC